jgi:hypothetical protein
MYKLFSIIGTKLYNKFKRFIENILYILTTCQNMTNRQLSPIYSSELSFQIESLITSYQKNLL